MPSAVIQEIVNALIEHGLDAAGRLLVKAVKDWYLEEMNLVSVEQIRTDPTLRVRTPSARCRSSRQVGSASPPQFIECGSMQFSLPERGSGLIWPGFGSDSYRSVAMAGVLTVRIRAAAASRDFTGYLLRCCWLWVFSMRLGISIFKQFEPARIQVCSNSAECVAERCALVVHVFAVAVPG